MSVNSHIHEYDSSEVDTFLSECGCRLSDIEAAEKFLHGIYPDDSDPDDESAYDMDKGKDDPEFKIQVNDNSMDDYYEENYLKIHLPNRDAADELAAILGGTVTQDGTTDTGSKTFRITYRKEIYIKADSKEEALAKFEAMDDDDMNSMSKFVEMSSCEEQ